MQETKKKIFDHPEVQKLMNDKNLDQRSLLSKFTILENNFSGLATNHICNYGSGAPIEDGEVNKKDVLKELITDTGKSMREMLYFLNS